MALLDQIKTRMFAAMKSGNVTEREILKVAMGEITTDAARPGTNLLVIEVVRRNPTSEIGVGGLIRPSFLFTTPG